MTVKDLILSCDIEQLLTTATQHIENSDERKCEEQSLHAFVLNIHNVVPVNSQKILSAYKFHDEFDDCDYYSVSVLIEYDMSKLQASYENVLYAERHWNDTSSVNMFKNHIDEFNETFYCPEFYAFDLTPLQEVLGYNVPAYVYQNNKYEVVSAILEEMTLLSYEDEEKSDLKNMLTERVAEIQKILAMPEDEQTQYIKDLDWKSVTVEISDEEKSIMDKQMVKNRFRAIKEAYLTITSQ